MTDYIDRQAAIDTICKHGTELERRGITVLTVINHKQVTVDLLENLPSAEVEPVKHGYWSHDYDDESITGTCSICGWQSMLMETDVADMPYCPNCGAKMDMPTIKAEPVIHCIDCITDETAQKIIEEAKSLKLRHCNKLGWAYCCGNCDKCRITVTTV